MTLTELKYIVAVARERHFGRAAEACFVSQPTLSVAIRKLEDELGVILFERGGSEVGSTPMGERIIAQAQKVLEVCPELARFSPTSEGIQRSFEGSSLETIRHMVAAGIGVTVLPAASVPREKSAADLLRYLEFAPPVPSRRVVLAWRKSFPRVAAIRELISAIEACDLPGVTMLDPSDADTVATPV